MDLIANLSMWAGFDNRLGFWSLMNLERDVVFVFSDKFVTEIEKVDADYQPTNS